MEFNVNPYYDDFEQNAANNNYVRVMFKPGYAVQARELTQIQSILQNQIKLFGDHIFQDGSPVIGGNLTLDNKTKFLKLQETYNNEDVEIETFDGKVVRSADGLVQAKVVTTYYPTDGTPTLLLKYITSNEFAEGAVIKIAGTTTQAQALTTNSNGSALVCSINEGVFYVDGFFVKVLDQSTPVNPYGVSANVKIGLEIDDQFVDSDVDTTLLDPAQGSFNYQAPGADRYQFSLRLTTRPLDSVVDESQFFELMRVENGAITKQVKYPIYSELEKTLARRTFDESGDYIVRPFRATILDGANANNYTIAVEPGKAYVKGFEFETIGTVKIDVPKPRGAGDVKSYVDIDVDTSYGAFVYATSFRGSNGGFVNIAALEKFDIHCVGTGNVNANIGLQTTANTFYYGNTKIGTARLKNFVRYSADGFDSVTDSNGVYKLYLSDIDINPVVAKVTAASSNANTIRLTDKFSPSDNAYLNVSVTILPVRLDAVADVYATVEANKFTVNANNSGTFAGKVNVGDTIRVGEFVREVTAVATGNLTVNSAFAYTVANSATNPVEVYVQQSYSQNVGGQTRNIIRYNGAGRTAFFDTPFDNGGVADVNTVFQLNFGIDDAKSFVAGPAVANTLNCTTLQNTAMNVSLFGTLTNGDTYVEDPQRGTLIFKLPGTYVSRTSLNNVDYFYNKFVPNRANNGTAGEFTLSQGSGLDSFETIPWADSTSAIQDNLIFVVRNNNGNTSYPNGTILQLTSANVTIGSPATTFTVNTAVPDILAVDIFVNVKVNDSEDLIRNKVYYSNTTYTYTPFTYPVSNATSNTTVTLTNLGEVAKIDMANGLVWLTNPTYNNIRPGDSVSLFIPDVVKVRRVLQGNNTSVPVGDANTSDITSRFFIDYGQKDDRYDHARLILKPGADSPTGMLLVHVDYYHHIYAAGANVSFFSPASYPEAQYNNGSIPVYTAADGTSYELRDCLDFRPTLPVGAVDDAYVVPNLTSPDSTTELSFNHYLPRIDKLVLSKDKEFRIIQGRSASVPYPPEDLDDAMTLFVINLPAYVGDIRQVGLRYIDNRRLTMKELASLNKRVERLEQYTSLNNVENLALSDPTQYEDGTEKEKFGILGENFSNFNIADFRNPDFTVAVDGGFLVPQMENKPLSFKNIVRTNTKKNLRTLSLNFTETPAITQNVASNAVKISPFLFGRFNGIIDLTPETDFWCSDRLKPEVIAEPSQIVEQSRRIRELVFEDLDISTIPFVTNDASTLIIETPNTDPSTNANATVVVAPAEEPPPVLPSDPVPIELPALPPVSPDVPSAWIEVAPAIAYPQPVIEPTVLPAAASIFSGGGLDLFAAVNINFQEPTVAVQGPLDSSIPSSSEPVKAPTGGGGRSINKDPLNFRYDRN